MNSIDDKYILEIINEIISLTENELSTTDKQKLVSNEGKNRYGDTTIRADRIAEQVTIDVLKKHFKNFLLISEELGIKKFGDISLGDPVFILDPLDGSTNFKRSIPYYSISIAYTPYKDDMKLSDIKVGVVKELSGNNRFYYAIKGKGAWLNSGIRLKPSSTTNLESALVEVNPVMTGKPEIVDMLVPLFKKVYDIRRLGSAALTICNIADGTIDAAIDIRGKLRIVDVAAAYLIAKEAGVSIHSEDYSILLKTRVNFVMAGTNDLLLSILNIIEQV